MANSKVETVSLEWTYSPKDYFEEPIKIENDQYILEIDSGNVKATMVQDSNIRKGLEDEVLARFQGCQVISYKKFNLSGPTLIKNCSGGIRNIFLELKDEVKLQESTDYIIQDGDGKFTIDTKSDRMRAKSDRMREQSKLADLSAKFYKDGTLKAILESNNKSINDPGNAFIFLYEIRETLSKRFGGERNVKRKLKISQTNWSRLGKLSNDEPTKQGRHRGKNFESLRDATEEELKEARQIVKILIQKYLEYLEGLSE